MGIPVPFFGVKVDTLAAVGTLSQRYGSSIIPVQAVRGDDGIVRVIIEPEVEFQRR